MPAETHQQTCLHCGTPYAPGSGSGKFCCTGCEYVYGVIQEGGFNEFYRLKNTRLKPVREKPFVEKDWQWLDDWQSAAEQGEGGKAKASQSGGVLAVDGITCVGCVWLIQRVFERQPGAGHIEVEADRGLLHLRWEKGTFSGRALAEALQQFGYLVQRPNPARLRQVSAPAIRTGLAALFAIHAYGFSLPRYYPIELADVHLRIFLLLSVFFYLITFAVAVLPLLERPLRALREGRRPEGYAPGLALTLGAGLSLVGILAHVPSLYQFDSFALAAVLLCLIRWLRPEQAEVADQQPQQTVGLAALVLAGVFGVMNGSAVVGLAAFCFVLLAGAPLRRADSLGLYMRATAFTLLFLVLGFTWLWLAAIIHAGVLGFQYLGQLVAKQAGRAS